MLRALPPAPIPATFAPPFPARISAIIDKLRELEVGDRAARHRKGPDRDAMRPFFVIEDELLPRHRTEPVCPAFDVDIATVDFLRGRFGSCSPAGRRRVSQCVPRVS